MGLDVFELIMDWENAFGIQFEDKELSKIFTLKMALELIAAKVGASCAEFGKCPTLCAYLRVRKAFQRILGVEIRNIRLDAKLLNLIPKNGRDQIWEEICVDIGLAKYPKLKFGTGIIFTPITILDFVDELVSHHSDLFFPNEHKWTSSEVCSVTRAIVRNNTGVKNFKDDVDLTRELFYRLSGLY